MVEATDFKFDT